MPMYLVETKIAGNKTVQMRFADFREPVIITAIAVFGAMDRRQARTWVVLGCLGLLAISSALIWTKPRCWCACSTIPGSKDTYLVLLGCFMKWTVPAMKR